ncbi:FAD-binding protein [Micromonospora sp. WMMD1082]|uniref:FAD-binding oxidoreductase n=1 Tax=Micromonospora sp. WMMD1082 TaxID=3016104 RepID=UPI002417F778|nr:FAD-binding protein [Micromonospora sp. WMMD1082]MDG4795712.1 FAD-binding protein [Micromonospora sp. WMMD1082]
MQDKNPIPNLGRRRFLGLSLGTAIGAASLMAGCGTPGPTVTPKPTPMPIGTLRERVRGKVLAPDEAGYADEVKGYNLTLERRPRLVVAAAGPADVQAAVQYAATNGLAVAVLATGHQNSVPIDDNTLLVTTRTLRGVTIDKSTSTARVEAGALWQDVVAKSTKVGLAPLNGSTPIVGVVGYTVGGGLSPTLGRAHGYAADHVTSLEVVTADGELRTVNAGSEPDLFFAIRGGKSNFGIVTGMEFRLFPVRTLYAGVLVYPGEAATAVLEAYRSWTATVPDAMSSSVALLRLPDVPAVPEPLRGQLVAQVRISYAGNAAEGAKLVAPLRSAPGPMLDTVTEIPYEQFATIHADPTDPLPAYERTASLSELTSDAIREIVALAGPKAPYPLTMVELRHLGGALARQPEVPNAIATRDAAFTLFTASIGAPTDAAAIKQAQTDLIERLRPWSTGAMFVNFMTTEETTPDQVRDAYSAGLYDRLASIKRRHDPENLFRLNHNIRPA